MAGIAMYIAMSQPDASTLKWHILLVAPKSMVGADNRADVSETVQSLRNT